jgi:hypothetical protein
MLHAITGGDLRRNDRGGTPFRLHEAGLDGLYQSTRDGAAWSGMICQFTDLNPAIPAMRKRRQYSMAD